MDVPSSLQNTTLLLCYSHPRTELSPVKAIFHLYIIKVAFHLQSLILAGYEIRKLFKEGVIEYKIDGRLMLISYDIALNTEHYSERTNAKELSISLVASFSRRKLLFSMVSKMLHNNFYAETLVQDTATVLFVVK